MPSATRFVANPPPSAWPPPAQVNERANSDVERQVVTGQDGATRLRFKMTCPKCGQTPVYRQDLIDAALAAIYERGADPKIQQYAI